MTKIRKICERGGCENVQKARGLCKKHYDRERGAPPRAHRHREDRVLALRARNRAVARLVKLHVEEFRALYEETIVEVLAEDVELRRVAEAMGAEPTDDRQVVRLKRGPAREDEEIADRIELGPACSQCEVYHGRGHHCLHCGALPSRAIVDSNRFSPILVPAELSDERLAAAIAKGERRRGPDPMPDDDELDEAEVGP